MRLASLLPCGLAALCLAAEPLRGIPDDVLVGVRISYDTAAKSKLQPAMKAMQRRMEAAAERLNPGQVQAGKDLQASLGAAEDGAHHLDLGVRVNAGAAGPDIAFFGAMRLEMSKAKFDAFAKQQGAAAVAVGGASGWDLASLLGALQKVSGAPEQIPLEAILQSPHAVMMPADGVLLVAPVAELGKTLDRWNGKAASLAPPCEHGDRRRRDPLCHTTVHADVAKMAALDTEAAEPGVPAEPFAGGMTRAALHLGEDATDVRLLAGATFATEAQAKLAADQVRAFLPIGAMATMPADEDDEDTRFMKSEAAALLGSVMVNQQGTELQLVAKHGVERCKAILGKLEKQVLATLEAAAPGPALPPPAGAPAVAPKAEADKKTDQKGR